MSNSIEPAASCNFFQILNWNDIDEEMYYMSQVEVVLLSSGHVLHEVIFYKKYSTSSDVLSYGMLTYEIWSLGHKPFENKTVDEVW